MPGYADLLTPEQRWDVVHFVQSLERGSNLVDYLFYDNAGRYWH